MRHLAEAMAKKDASMRLPILAYHDTMFPGAQIDAPKNSFLLFAPRERCYAHALNEPACARNRVYYKALQEWMKKFKGIDDAHMFEYYFDQVLFRGIYPFLPNTILEDLKVYAGMASNAVSRCKSPVPRLRLSSTCWSLPWDSGMQSSL